MLDTSRSLVLADGLHWLPDCSLGRPPSVVELEKSLFASVELTKPWFGGPACDDLKEETSTFWGGDWDVSGSSGRFWKEPRNRGDPGPLLAWVELENGWLNT